MIVKFEVDFSVEKKEKKEKRDYTFLSSSFQALKKILLRSKELSKQHVAVIVVVAAAAAEVAAAISVLAETNKTYMPPSFQEGARESGARIVGIISSFGYVRDGSRMKKRVPFANVGS